MYIHELTEWPNFTWDTAALNSLLETAHNLEQHLSREMQKLGFADQSEASLRILTDDVVKTSEIEGELLDPALVRSSIARRLGLDSGGLPQKHRNVEGIVEVILDATQRHSDPLTQERLCGWHALLFPTGWSGPYQILVGQWRTAPMQVVSGAIGKEKVHFFGPSEIRMTEEMQKFLAWFESNATADPFIKAGVAHLYFVTIHPFDDGNGRIARAIADLVLARAEAQHQRFYSMSAQIRNERKAYYDILERTQKSTLDITDWLEWFLSCLIRAIEGANVVLNDVLRKVRVWSYLQNANINDRQRKMLNLLLDRELDGVLNTPKWVKMNKCSSDTALRDITDLLQLGVLEKGPGVGRKTNYVLRDPPKKTVAKEP